MYCIYALVVSQVMSVESGKSRCDAMVEVVLESLQVEVHG